MDKILSRLEAKLDEIDQLKKESSYSAKYQIWNTMTERLLKQCLDEEMVKIFREVLQIDSYRSSTESHENYLDHLNKKYEALKNLITAIKENEIAPQNEIYTTKISSQENNNNSDKKRTRKTRLGFNIGFLNGKIEEEREI